MPADHDHTGQVAAYGECLTCATAPPEPVPAATVGQPVAAPATLLDFDGATYRRARDQARLGGQLGRVTDALADGRWWTLAQLAEHTGDPEASVSARIRDLRKGRFGGWTVVAENLGGGTWRYRLCTDHA